MTPSLTLTEDRKEMDAQHLVCSYLVRACREAMYELALDDRTDPGVRHRAIEVLKIVHQDWIAAQKAVARELGKSPLQARPSTAPTPIIEPSSRRWVETR